jgi:hypothetical protein
MFFLLAMDRFHGSIGGSRWHGYSAFTQINAGHSAGCKIHGWPIKFIICAKRACSFGALDTGMPGQKFFLWLNQLSFTFEHHDTYKVRMRTIQMLAGIVTILPNLFIG